MAPDHFDLLVYGAGGHGIVVAELSQILGFKTIGLFDDHNPALPLPAGVYFLGRYTSEASPNTPLVIAIGNNEVRQKLALSITHPFAVLVHPSAVVSPSVLLGAGTVVLAGAILQARCLIGAHNIINAGVVVDHDVTTGDCVHIRPHAYIASNASLSEKRTIEPCQVVERFSVL